MPDGGKYYMLKNKAKTGTRMLVWKRVCSFQQGGQCQRVPCRGESGFVSTDGTSSWDPKWYLQLKAETRSLKGGMWGTPQGRFLVGHSADVFYSSFVSSTMGLCLWSRTVTHKSQLPHKQVWDLERSLLPSGTFSGRVLQIMESALPGTTHRTVGFIPVPEITILVPQSSGKAGNRIQRCILTVGIRDEQTCLWCEFLSGALIPIGFPLLRGVRQMVLPRR